MRGWRNRSPVTPRPTALPVPQLLSAMVARLGNRHDPLPQDSFEGVDEAEWVSVAGPRGEGRKDRAWASPSPASTGLGRGRTPRRCADPRPRRRGAVSNPARARGQAPPLKPLQPRPWLLCLCEGTEAEGRGENGGRSPASLARVRGAHGPDLPAQRGRQGAPLPGGGRRSAPCPPLSDPAPLRGAEAAEGTMVSGGACACCAAPTGTQSLGRGLWGRDGVTGPGGGVSGLGEPGVGATRGSRSGESGRGRVRSDGARGGGGGAGACPGGNGAWQARRVPAGLQWGGGRGRDSRLSPQAKYLAQIILVGAQVVGRAFMRALRQELAGRS